mmetsp:Transcript_64132/g.105333  ORF Transcript_64132/g.105333 Transcript_64132/m.105333 type:complete len:907 (-) Transcript_64132:41-2761(-)
MPGFESLLPDKGATAAEAQKSLDKVAAAGRAAALAEFANALGREGRYEESLSKGLEALDLCEEQKDKKGKGCCFYILGRTHFLKGALLSAQHVASKALALFQDGESWAEASAKLLVTAAMARGPGGPAVAVLAAEGLCDVQVLRARCAAKLAAEAMQAATERRRQSLLRISEAKVLINRGDHEAALNCVADAFSLAEGEPDELSGPPSMCPATLGLGLHAEASSLMAAVDILGKSAKFQAASGVFKANAMAMQGDLSGAKKAASEAAASSDVAAQVAAFSTLAAIQAILEEKAEAVQAADRAMELAKGLGKPAQISAMCLASFVQADGAQAQAALNLAAESDLMQVEALSSLAQAQLNYQHLPSEALGSSQKLLMNFRALKDTLGQVAAGSMVALCHSMLGQVAPARAAASDAVKLAMDSQDMGSEAGALLASMLSALTGNRPADALDNARRVLKICRHFEDPVAEAWGLLELSRLQLAEDPGQGVRSAEEALEIASKASPSLLARRALAAATLVLARAHALREKPVAARRVVEKLQDLPGRGSDVLALGRRGEGLQQLLAAQVLKEHVAGLGAARNAQALLNGVRDKAGEAAANLAYANALCAQQNFEGATDAAIAATAGFKAAKCAVGEGTALCALAGVQLRREDALEAEKTAKEALRIFQQVRSFSGLKRCSALLGETRARQLLAHTQLSSLQPSSARVFFDEFNCAHLEITEMASQESLEAVVATLHGMQRTRNNVKAIVMHLDGIVGPSNMHSYALSSGNFLVGLRSISIPIILAGSGKISGPSWQLFLGCDYRICSMDTDFLLPITSPPECLGELVGPAVASQLCISSGILDAQAVQELGILNQVRPSKDETGRAAAELGKRIAGFPGIACRQTMSLLTVPPVRYTTLGSQKLPDPDVIA